MRDLIKEYEEIANVPQDERPSFLIENANDKIIKYEKEIKQLKSELKALTDHLEIRNTELDQEIDAREELQSKFDSLNEDFKKIKSELKESKKKVNEYKIGHSNDVSSFEKELSQRKEAYDKNLHSLILENKSKDHLIKNLQDQLAEFEEFDGSTQENPFENVSGIDIDNSLFDELGGDTGGRSQSLLPRTYKNLTKELKRRFNMA